jgi:hypothetical protein
MLHALSAVRPGILLVGAGVAVGLYALQTRSNVSLVPPAPPTPKAVVFVPPVIAPPSLPADDATDDDVDDTVDEDVELEEIRGMDPIEDPAEFAMVFSVDGVSYLRLSADEQATSHGHERMVDDGTSIAVIAPVSMSAVSPEMRRWAGRTVMVDGTCRARVVGFAEVSRVAGDPPGTGDYYYSPEEDRPDEKPEWTIESVRADNVVLAAKLDGCSGSWARGTEFSPAAIATMDSDAELEAAALADLTAKTDYDAVQERWKENGGEGDWRAAVAPTVVMYTHPLTGEHWIFASAYQYGDCGSPGLAVMAAYRATADGKVHRVADLDYAGQTLDTVIDVDGDGQPELLVGGGDNMDLVDLKNTNHDSISVTYHSWGCGC